MCHCDSVCMSLSTKTLYCKLYFNLWAFKMLQPWSPLREKWRMITFLESLPGQLFSRGVEGCLSLSLSPWLMKNAAVENHPSSAGGHEWQCSSMPRRTTVTTEPLCRVRNCFSFLLLRKLSGDFVQKKVPLLLYSSVLHTLAHHSLARITPCSYTTRHSWPLLHHSAHIHFVQHKLNRFWVLI